MCIKFGSPKIAPPIPPPLAPPPPPPEKPTQPLPEPEAVDAEVNPQVRRSQSQKEQNPYAQGTESLRIDLDPNVNTGAEGGASGGLNACTHVRHTTN